MMKLKNSILPMLLGLFGIAFFAACSPDKPENEKGNKLHEDPTKLSLDHKSRRQHREV